MPGTPPRPRRRPGRTSVRSERATRRDLVTAGVVTVAVLGTAGAVLLTGSAHGSGFTPPDEAQPAYGAAVLEPASLSEVYRVPSQGSGAPVVTKGNLVAQDGGAIVGYEAGNRVEKWRYAHDGTLCTSAFYAEKVVSVWNGASGCSDVTALNPTSRAYDGTRQSAFGETANSWHTWNHMLVQDSDRVEVWRSDLVRTVEYGHVDAPQESGMQPRSGCTIDSAGLADERFAVSERCPGENSQRLTVSKTVPKDSRKPEEVTSGPTGADEVHVLDVGASHVLAVQRLGGTWSVESYSTADRHTTSLRLPGPPAVLPSPDTVVIDNAQVRWWDGVNTHAFSAADGTHAWTARDTRGPGIAVGYGVGAEPQPSYRWTMLPTGQGFSVVESAGGRETRRMQLPTPREPGLVGLSQVGDIAYERRAGEIVAYKMTPAG